MPSGTPRHRAQQKKSMVILVIAMIVLGALMIYLDKDFTDLPPQFGHQSAPPSTQDPFKAPFVDPKEPHGSISGAPTSNDVSPISQPPIPSSNQANVDSLPKLEPPLIAKMREEVGRDPHGHPPSLMAFAEDISDWMEEAKKSLPVAQSLVAHLEACIKGQRGNEIEDPAPSVQAFCLESLREVVEIYPNSAEFKQKHEDLLFRAPEETRVLLQALEQAVKGPYSQ